MLSLPLLSGLAGAILATSFLSGLFGMAGGMILMGVLLVMLPVAQAMVLHGVTQLAANGWRAWLWRRHVAWPVAAGYAAGGLLALAVFAGLRLVPDKAVVLVALGAMPFAARLLPERLAPNVARRGGALLCGTVCTALQLLAGVSGPVLDLFFHDSGLDRRAIVATKALTQSLGHGLKLVYFGGLAGAGLPEAPVVLLAVTVAVAGTTLARGMLERMDESVFRLWSRRIITMTALVYLGQGAWELTGLP